MNAPSRFLDLQDALSVQHRFARGVASVLANGDLAHVPRRDLMAAAEVIYSALNRAASLVEEMSALFVRGGPVAKPAAWPGIHDRFYGAHAQGSAIASLIVHGELDDVPDADMVCAFEALLALVGEADNARDELTKVRLDAAHPSQRENHDGTS